MFELFVVLLTLAGIFSYVNHRFLKLPGTIGVTINVHGLSIKHYTRRLKLTSS